MKHSGAAALSHVSCASPVQLDLLAIQQTHQHKVYTASKCSRLQLPSLKCTPVHVLETCLHAPGSPALQHAVLTASGCAVLCLRALMLCCAVPRRDQDKIKKQQGKKKERKLRLIGTADGKMRRSARCVCGPLRAFVLALVGFDWLVQWVVCCVTITH